jgi:hypothetical protein
VTVRCLAALLAAALITTLAGCGPLPARALCAQIQGHHICATPPPERKESAAQDDSRAATPGNLVGLRAAVR